MLRIKDFIRQYGIVGWIIFFTIASFVFLLFLEILIRPYFHYVTENIELPSRFEAAMYKPWTLLTYCFYYPVSHIWTMIVDCLILFSFTQILIMLIGRQKTSGLVINGLIFNAILSVLLITAMSDFIDGKEMFITGLSPLNATLIIASITLVPKYQYTIIRWKVPLWALGGVLLFILIATNGLIYKPTGITVFTGIVMGFLMMIGIKTGIDVTTWTRFMFKKEQKPVFQKEKVKVLRQNSIHVVNSDHSSDESDEEILNRLLDKINKVGYEKLSRDEKETLDRISKKG